MKTRFPLYGYLGVLLVITFWYLNWHLTGLRTHWAFFPLWIGYILSVCGFTHRLKGSSLLSRNFWAWCWLFIVSAPVWWIFEAFNSIAHYWNYLGVESFSNFQYNLFATISFSTVIPAVFCTAELIGQTTILKNTINGPKVGSQNSVRIFFFCTGWLMLASFYFWPEYSPAFLWISLFFILDPINYAMGYPSILRETGGGDWSTVIRLWLASLICGFFWEMWNFYAFPKWIYDIPYVDFWHVFEMPLIGYLGYLPFALELYAMYHLILGLLQFRSFLQFRSETKQDR